MEKRMKARWYRAVLRSCVIAALSGTVAAQTAAPNAPPGLGANLDGLLAYARERHPELRSMRYEADAAAQRAKSAGALSDPTLQVELMDLNNGGATGYNLLPSKVGSTKYTYQQAFPAWGKRDAQRQAAGAASDEAASRVEVTWTDLEMRIKTAYARYRQDLDSLQQTRALLELIDQLEAAAQVRYAGGLAPQQDAIRAQVERTSMRSDIALLEADLAAMKARINGLLARPSNAPLTNPQSEDALPPLTRVDLAALRDRVLARNPLLKAEDARIRAAEGNKDAVFANRHPEFMVGIAPTQVGTSIGSWEAMFTVSIPVWQDRRRADESEALAMISAAQARREAALNDLMAQLGEDVATFEAAFRVETLTRTSLLPQSEVAWQSALAGYQTGKVDFQAVLDAARQIRQARLTLIRTHADARMKQAEIERLLGDAL
jgi:outer membrane protein TolC